MTNLTRANNLFAPTIRALLTTANQVGLESIDLWQLINWMFVTQYWTLLYDFGEIQPTIYKRNDTIPRVFIPYVFPETNNIFINETLFEIYARYFRDTVIPLLTGMYQPDLTFQPLGANNRLRSTAVAFDMAYYCIESELKSPLSLVIALLVADLSMFQTAYTVIKGIVGSWQKKKNPKDGASRFYS